MQPLSRTPRESPRTQTSDLPRPCDKHQWVQQKKKGNMPPVRSERFSKTRETDQTEKVQRTWSQPLNWLLHSPKPLRGQQTWHTRAQAHPRHRAWCRRVPLHKCAPHREASPGLLRTGSRSTSRVYRWHRDRSIGCSSSALRRPLCSRNQTPSSSCHPHGAEYFYQQSAARQHDTQTRWRWCCRWRWRWRWLWRWRWRCRWSWSWRQWRCCCR